MLLIFVGTKAQYIKTAPILLALGRRGIAYRLVYTGQHCETFAELEADFGTRAPDENWVPNSEADTKATFASWTFRFWKRACRWLLRKESAGARMVLVHGDTASTLFGALVARIAGLPVCHVEAGLRSDRLFDPFPEELIRRLVSRLTALHCAPDAAAVRNLEGVRGTVVDTRGNTLLDALALALAREQSLPDKGGEGGYAVVSLHRNENLSNAEDFELLMREIAAAAATLPLRFVLHPATRAKLAATGWDTRLQEVSNLMLLPRSDHRSFLRLLIGATCLLTDGGSNQEEAAMLGIPCLLLRRRTERPDGLGDVVEVSGLEANTIRRFVATHRQTRWTLRPLRSESPSDRVVDAIQRWPTVAA